MEKEQYRSVIVFLSLHGKTREEIKEKLRAFYKDHVPSMTTITYWFNKFERGRTCAFDEKRLGRSIEVTTGDAVNKIHTIMFVDRRVKTKETTDIANI